MVDTQPLTPEQLRLIQALTDDDRQVWDITKNLTWMDRAALRAALARLDHLERLRTERDRLLAACQSAALYLTFNGGQDEAKAILCAAIAQANAVHAEERTDADA